MQLLTVEQNVAFNKYIEGNNIFITGPGGTGKSMLIRSIYEHAYNHHKNIHITALTGCAAVVLHKQAKTIHSWAGVGLGAGSLESIIKKIRSNIYSKKIWETTEILIVDEVSMLSQKLFELLAVVGQIIRKNDKPFGGIQLIFSGDFYQLPPVGNDDDVTSKNFCFESDLWNDIFNIHNQIVLKQVFRQTDQSYINMLNQIREGIIKKNTIETLMQYVGREPDTTLVTKPTKIFPTRNKVDNINRQSLENLSGKLHVFKLKIHCEKEKDKDKDISNEINYLVSNLICEGELNLKIGAQVMSIINITNDDNILIICNGSQGIVTGFSDYTNEPIVKFNNGLEIVMRYNFWQSDKNPNVGVSQVPLILAWAVTIHKSQGATLDAAEIDIGTGVFACGQSYVALSRVTSLCGLYLTSFDFKKILINKKVKAFYQILKNK